MHKTLHTLILASTLLFNVASISALTLEKELTQANGLAINLVQANNETLSGRLIDADEAYFVFANSTDESVQVVPRHEVNMLEANIGVNLYQVMKAQDKTALSDQIELEDGTFISCIILDISQTSIQYFAGESLKRHVVAADDVYMLHISSDAVQIPFPMLSAAIPSI